jgi:NADH dehydrogenase FAD-containing subunit
MRIVVLGGGFAGVATVRQLERLLRSRADVELTLVS